MVKRHGHVEKFDARKVYATVYEAVHATRATEEKAEKIASRVSQKITKMVEKMNQIPAHWIHAEVVKELKKHHADAAFMYETHRDVC